MFNRGVASLALLLTLVLSSGCGTTKHPPFEPLPDDTGNVRTVNEFFAKGDLVVINYSLPGAQDKKAHEERVKEDGTISPPEIQPVKAEGKTPGELQREIQAQYSRLYPHITITVKGQDRFYHVEGEVKNTGPKVYLGGTDIVKAIAAAGGFTEFARKSRVQLIRPDGSKEIINYNDAISDPAKNLKVYPNDTVYVPRRIF